MSIIHRIRTAVCYFFGHVWEFAYQPDRMRLPEVYCERCGATEPWQ